MPKESAVRCRGSPRRWQLHDRVLLGKTPRLFFQIGLKGPSMPHSLLKPNPDTGKRSVPTGLQFRKKMLQGSVTTRGHEGDLQPRDLPPRLPEA